MAEPCGANCDIAQQTNESAVYSLPSESARMHQIVEILEALLLAIVALITAWSGYEAARWNSVQSKLYGTSSRLRVEGQVLDVQANQIKMYNAATVVEWLKSEAHGEKRLAELFEKRLLPDFRPAFEAWKATDPVHNPNAPVGPTAMPGYQDSKAQEAAERNRQATEAFEQGTLAREHGDDYVRIAVLLATVLFLIAISQRFRSYKVRTALIIVAFLMLCVPIVQVVRLPLT
jgi:hypothetical protein